MPTAATAIDACLEGQKQTAGLPASTVARAKVGGRRKIDLRRRLANAVERSLRRPSQRGMYFGLSGMVLCQTPGITVR